MPLLKRNSLTRLPISLYLLFLPLQVFSQTGPDPLNDLQNSLKNATGTERLALLEQTALAYELSGELTAASEAYLFLWEDSGYIHQEARLRYYQLQYEMGNWDILKDVSSLAVNPSVSDRLGFLELEIRLLMSMGYWEEAGVLIESNLEWMDPRVSLLYLSWYFYSIEGDRIAMAELKSRIVTPYPDSPEAWMVNGLADESIRPSLLMMSKGSRQEKFYYQIGAFKEESSSDELVQKMLSQHFHPEILLDKGWYKVLIPIDSPQVETLLDTLTEQGLRPFRVSF